MIYQERPILFSPKFVRAIIAGKKTQTRRILQPQPVLGEHWRHGWIVDPARVDIPVELNPYGNRLDRLYVRERFGYVWPDDCDDGRIYDEGNYEFGRPITREEMNVVYYADDPEFTWWDEEAEDNQTTRHWKPSIHMPKSRARLWLEIEQVRLERLQQITAADARAEGIVLREQVALLGQFRYQRHQSTYHPSAFNYSDDDYIALFRFEWNKLNGDRAGGSWLDDPWVWVIDFKVNEIKA